MTHTIEPAAKPSQPTLHAPLLPWLVVSHGAVAAPEQRMMWAQSGVSRLFSVLGDLSLTLRAAMSRVGRASETPRATVAE